MKKPGTKSSNDTVIQKILLIEAMANSTLIECQKLRELLKADVTTSAKNNKTSAIAIEARTKLRSKLFKKGG